MALQTLAGFASILQVLGISSLSYSSALLSASGDKFAFIIKAPQTGTLDRIRFPLRTVTTGQTLRAGAYTLDSSGNPTTTAFGGMAVGTVAVADSDDNTEKEIIFATGASVTRGDRIAIVIEFDSTVGNLNIGYISGGNAFPYTAHFVAAAWTKGTLLAGIAVGYSDGSYVNIPNLIPATSAVSTVSFNSSTALADEYALRFQLPFACRIDGLLFLGSQVTGADFDYLLYDGTTVETQNTQEAIYVGATNTRTFPLLFTTPITLDANVVRRLALKPTTTTSIGLNTITVGANAVLGAALGINCFLSRRVDAGAWTDVDTQLPCIIPLISQLSDNAGTGGGLIIVED